MSDEEPPTKISIQERFRGAVDRLLGRAHDWTHGTQEKPLPPFSYRARLLRWWRVSFCGYVYLVTTMYDRPNDEYIYRRDIVKRSELERDAVPVTNMKSTWHIDLDLPKRGFSSVADDGFTAVDAYLYARCNKIEEAMRIQLDNPQTMDVKKLIVYAGIGVGVLLALYILMGH